MSEVHLLLQLCLTRDPLQVFSGGVPATRLRPETSCSCSFEISHPAHFTPTIWRRRAPSLLDAAPGRVVKEVVKALLTVMEVLKVLKTRGSGWWTDAQLLPRGGKTNRI